jgi:hypothetical protein
MQHPLLAWCLQLSALLPTYLRRKMQPLLVVAWVVATSIIDPSSLASKQRGCLRQPLFLWNPSNTSLK